MGLPAVGGLLLLVCSVAYAADGTQPSCVEGGKVYFQEVAGPTFSVGSHVEPADRLPDEVLGWWSSKRSMLLVTPASIIEIIETNRGRLLPKDEFALLGHGYQVTGRAGHTYGYRYRLRDQEIRERTLAWVDDQLEMTVLFDVATRQMVACMLGREKGPLTAEGRYVYRWSRRRTPKDGSPWVDRAVLSLYEVTRRPTLRATADQVLALSWWPFRSVEVIDVYAIPRDAAVDLVVRYSAGGQERLWTSLLGPEGVRSSGDFSSLGDAVPEAPELRVNDVGVPPLLGAWSRQVVVPLLPRP